MSNNTKIAKNTIALYLRMFITMAVGLYTSRIVIKTLGIDDYGIYNIVGGVVVLLSFISNALRNGTQRFLSYELGKEKDRNVQRVFNTAIQCHLFICLILIVLAETIGLWFISTKLNIPEGRELAVQYVYQFSVLTFLLHVIQTPFNSAIISYERMSFYAYISIIEAVLKLGMVFLLVLSPWDKLIVYSALIAIVAFIILTAYMAYCAFVLKLNNFYVVKDKELQNHLLSFSGWSMANGCANLLAQQGGNYLINIFNGVAANAAFGIANQVSSVVYSFVSNFQSAFQPQIVKQYAGKEYDSLKLLIYRSSSLSYYLLLIITIPFACEAEYILNLWLGTIPEHSTVFCILLLCYFLIDAIQAPLWMLIYGTGDIKQYTVVTGILTVLNIPIAWLLLYLRYPLYSIFIVRIILNIVCCVYRMIYMKRKIGFSSNEYIKTVVLRALLVTILAVISVGLVSSTKLSPIIIITIALIITCMIIAFFGLNRHDRASVIALISKYQ